MKNKLLRALAAVMACLMLAAGFAGCSGDNGGTNDPANSPTSEFTYVPEYVQVPSEITSMDHLRVVGDKLYFSSYGMVSSTTPRAMAASSVTVDEGGTVEPEGEAMTYVTKIYTMNIDGTGLTELSAYTPGTKPEGLEGEYNINALSVDSEGNIWVVESGYFYHYELPADFNAETDDMWNYYVDDGNSMAMRRLDATGAEIATVDIEALKANNENFYIGAMEMDDQGNIYISDGNMTIYVLDSTGAVQFKVEASDWINSLIKMQDGTVAASGYLESGYAFKRIDVTTKGWGEEISLPSNVYNVYQGGGDYACTYGDNSSLYGLNAATGEGEKLLTWINCDVNSDGVSNINVLPDGRILCSSSTWNDSTGEQTFELIIMTKTATADIAQKTVLKMATMYLDYNLRNAIIDFNKTNGQYRIEVQDYSEFNTDDDYNAGITKLSTEIISGNVPDLLDVSSLPADQYAAKGLLEDLYPYIDNDPELSRDALMGSVLGAMESGGKLYRISSSFSVFTVIGNPSVLGSEPGWTMDEMNEVLAANPNATSPFGQYMTRDGFLYNAMVIGMDKYVDWATGQCSFDQGEFAKLLEFCATFPAQNDDNQEYISDVELINSGKQIAYMFSASDFESFQMYKAMFGGNIVFKGFPTDNRDGNAVSINGGLAMTTKCSDKEGAWQFMRTILTEDWQTNNVTWNFPTNKAAFDAQLKKAMTPEYTTDENGNQVEVSQGTWGMDGLEVEIYAVTQAEADQIMELINSVSSTMSYDDSMMNIITEETSAFFSGQKSAEETASIIQNRVSIYVAEQS